MGLGQSVADNNVEVLINNILNSGSCLLLKKQNHKTGKHLQMALTMRRA